MRTVKELEKAYQDLKTQVKREDINKGGKSFISERIRVLEVLLWVNKSTIIPELTFDENTIKMLNQMGE